jgi:hypothetical protein
MPALPINLGKNTSECRDQKQPYKLIVALPPYTNPNLEWNQSWVDGFEGGLGVSYGTTEPFRYFELESP